MKEVPEDRNDVCEGAGVSSSWPQFPFVSSKNTKKISFTFKLMWLPRGEGRASLEAPRLSSVVSSVSTSQS